MPDAVVIVEVPSLKTVFANQYAETITEGRFGRPSNLDLNELEGQVLRPDGQPYERDDWPLMRAIRGERVADDECVYRLPDGNEMKFRISSAPVYDPDGTIVAAVAVGRDISEQDSADSASLDRGL